MEHAKAPGLKLRPRAGRPPVPYWIATPAAVAAGYPVKTVNLTGVEDVAARCHTLQGEMLEWMGRPRVRSFDGTLGALLAIYQTHEDSPFHNLKPGSRHPYVSYLRKLTATYGDVRLARMTALDVKGWHKVWRAPVVAGGAERLGAAAMALAVLKSALNFGMVSGFSDCSRLREAMKAMTLPSPSPRDQAPTAADVERALTAAHELGRPRLALCYALQFETMVRQWDLIGQWAPLSDPRPSAVTWKGEKWIGPTWAAIDENLVLTITPTKTEKSTRARVHVNLSRCPMVMKELASIPESARMGPLIVNEHTGLPWHADTFRSAWAEVRERAGLPTSLWNRDLRAGGNTEAEIAGAGVEDRAKVAGHSTKVNERVYSRDRLAASDRVVQLRAKLRSGE